MKRIGLLVLLLAFTLGIVSCVEVVGEVESIEIINWTPREFYELGSTPDLSGAEVRISFEDIVDQQTLNLSSAELTIRGTGVKFDGSGNVMLNTDTTGPKSITVTYDTISVTVNFTVVEHLISPGDDGSDIQAMIDGLTVGDNLYISPGEYSVPATLTISTAGISIIGSALIPTTLVSDDNVSIFIVDAENVTIENLTMTTSYLAGKGYSATYPPEMTWLVKVDSYAYPGIILFTENANGILIQDNVIFGGYSRDFNYDDMGTIAIRPLTDSFKTPGSGITLTALRNTIYGLRQAIQLGYGSSYNIGIIKDNVIFSTKGGILMTPATKEVAQAQDWKNNSWTANVPGGYRDRNENDIVFHSEVISGDYLAWHDYSDILDIAADNNDAFVIDRRYETDKDDVRKDRTHIYIKNQNAEDDPFFDDSTPYIGRKADGALKGDWGGNQRTPLWRDNEETSIRVALGLTDGYDFGDGTVVPDLQGLIEGGKIFVWNDATETWDLVPEEDYPEEYWD